MSLLERARVLSSNQTEAEQRLWYYLQCSPVFWSEIQASKICWELYRRFRLVLPNTDCRGRWREHAEQGEYDYRIPKTVFSNIKGKVEPESDLHVLMQPVMPLYV